MINDICINNYHKLSLIDPVTNPYPKKYINSYVSEIKSLIVPLSYTYESPFHYFKQLFCVMNNNIVLMLSKYIYKFYTNVSWVTL